MSRNEDFTPTPALKFTRRAARELRVAVYERDRFTCRGCGWKLAAEYIPKPYDGRYVLPSGNWRYGLDAPPGGGELHLDHIIPRSLGGPSTLENLQVLCGSCNYRKSSRLGWTGS